MELRSLRKIFCSTALGKHPYEISDDELVIRIIKSSIQMYVNWQLIDTEAELGCTLHSLQLPPAFNFLPAILTHSQHFG